jgi:DNA-binding SARP family transcriptional activator
MSQLNVRLFGKFSLLQNDCELECIQSAKAKELFCYLLLHRDQPHSREILATVLWGECTTAQSKKYLRQTLWQLQQALRLVSPLNGQSEFLQVDTECVRLELGADLWLDVGIFEQAFRPVQGVAGERLDERRASELRKAVALYQGCLLEGWYQDWCLYHRERLENNYLTMLDKLMAYSEVHRDYEAGIAFGERLLYQDRARERSYYRLMRLHYLAGDRAGALRQYQRCKAALKEELGVEPGKRTVELFDQICADCLPSVATECLREPPSEAVTIAPRDRAMGFLQRLCKIRSVLMKIRRRVDRDIQEVDTLLGSPSSPSSGQKD